MVPIHSQIQRKIDIYKHTKNLKYLFKEIFVDLLGLSLLQGLKFLWAPIRNLSRCISETADTSCTLGTLYYIGYSRTSSSPAPFQFTGNSRYSSVIRTPGTGFSMTSSTPGTFHCNRHSRTFSTLLLFSSPGTPGLLVLFLLFSSPGTPGLLVLLVLFITPGNRGILVLLVLFVSTPGTLKLLVRFALLSTPGSLGLRVPHIVVYSCYYSMILLVL